MLFKVGIVDNLPRISISPLILPKFPDYRTSRQAEAIKFLEEPNSGTLLSIDSRLINAERERQNIRSGDKFFVEKLLIDGYPSGVILQNQREAEEISEIFTYLKSNFSNILSQNSETDIITNQGDFQGQHLRNVLTLIGQSGLASVGKIREDKLSQLRTLDQKFSEKVEMLFGLMAKTNLSIFARYLNGIHQIEGKNDVFDEKEVLDQIFDKFGIPLVFRMKIQAENQSLYSNEKFLKSFFPLVHEPHDDLGILTTTLGTALDGLTFVRMNKDSKLEPYRFTTPSELLCFLGTLGAKFSPSYLRGRPPVHMVSANPAGLTNPKAHRGRVSVVMQLCLNRTDDSPVRDFLGHILSNGSYDEYSNHREDLYQNPLIEEVPAALQLGNKRFPLNPALAVKARQLLRLINSFSSSK